MKDNKIVVGITHGDINGISYEVIIKTLMDARIINFCIPIVYGSPKVVAYHRKTLLIDNFSLNLINSPEEANSKRANIINCVDDDIRVELGKSTPAAGLASFQSLEREVTDLYEKKIDVLVTCPINKDNIQSKDFSFPGHTEYLKFKFKSDTVLMLMVGEHLKVGVVTGHVPLSEVPKLIKEDIILDKLRLMNECLKADFGIIKPKIAVLGLNPHAGDNGLLGKEDAEIILPAVIKAKEEDIMALGPYPADGLFGSPEFFKFDAVLAMYHDQGLAPFKALSFDTGVNYTAGLSVVRTSPAHGTAFQIAGKGMASADSFRQSLFTAIDVFRHRKEYKEMSANKVDESILEENIAENKKNDKRKNEKNNNDK
ncbi:4-hydroxythreonine-4-phosphate dehydrogenase PdxA [Bacteroidota bacterium]